MATTTNAPTTSKQTDKKDLGATELQQTVDAITEQGYIGKKVDEIDNEAYTVAGVIAAKEQAKNAKD